MERITRSSLVTLHPIADEGRTMRDSSSVHLSTMFDHLSRNRRCATQTCYFQTHARLVNTLSRGFGAVLVMQRDVSSMIPKRQYSFLNLSSEIVWQVYDVAIFSFAIVHLIRPLRHLNERLLALILNDLDVGNANTSNVH